MNKYYSRTETQSNAAGNVCSFQGDKAVSPWAGVTPRPAPAAALDASATISGALLLLFSMHNPF